MIALNNVRRRLYVLLIIAASARIFMQLIAMPPYAGLDEIQHVAHLVFFAQEHRSPSTRELSIALYLDRSIHQQPNALPSFAQIGERWPDVIRSNRHLIVAKPLTPRDRRPYVATNYEAQQPPLYYVLAGPLAIRSSSVSELRSWRLMAGLLAIVTVVATAAAGEALFGTPGVLAAAFLLLMPTWFTLVARAGNDSLACAFVAVGFAISVRSAHRPSLWIAEGLAWGAAFATKLYTWPLAFVLGFVLWRERADGRRLRIVIGFAAIAILITLADLALRTNNALGVVAFDRPGGATLDAHVDVSEIIRVTIASAAWTSGQHGDALTPLAIALYLGSVVVLLAIAIARVKPRISIAIVALAAFAAAQLFNIISCVLARRAGNPVPIGGKEGWYWYLLAPIFIVIVVAPLMTRFRVGTFAVLAWMVLWDVLITEGALFHDYAGLTSPLHRTALFRWGPLFAPFTADLSGVAIGPFVSIITPLRVIECAALALLFFRHVVPRRIDPLLDAPIEMSERDRLSEQRYRDAISEEERNDPFTAMRYAEGVRWRQIVAKTVSPPARVLDVGAGNGAVELAFASAGFRVVSVETEWNDVARRLGVQRVIASANALPFRTATFDAALLLETIEHLGAAKAAFEEVARTMRPNAVALITTPPRWRYALRRDPHFGIRFLTLWSPEKQRQIAASRGFDQSHHFVDRIYSSTNQIGRTIAPLRIERVLSRSRLPRRWFWDAILARR